MPVTLQVDTVLAGRYRITDVIADGGMGVVYRAEDERLGRPVAVKTVAGDDPELLARLRREARLLARVSHPNVIDLYDVIEHDGTCCLVNEFVEGIGLGQLRGQLTAAQIGEAAAQLAGALGAAHEAGVVHRDIKPSNVIVGDRVRLLDFGVARHVEDSKITAVDGIVGTASYLAPEVLTGGPAGPAADVYALGLVLVELFTGRSAFRGSFSKTVAARLLGEPDLSGPIPDEWRQVIAGMVDRDPDARPTALEVVVQAQALVDACTVPSVEPRAGVPAVVDEPPRPVRRRRGRSMAGAAASAVVVAAVGFAVTHRDQAVPRAGSVGPAAARPTAPDHGPAATPTGPGSPSSDGPQSTTVEVAAVNSTLAPSSTTSPGPVPGATVTTGGPGGPGPVAGPTSSTRPPTTVAPPTTGPGGVTEPVQRLLDGVDHLTGPLLP